MLSKTASSVPNLNKKRIFNQTSQASVKLSSDLTQNQSGIKNNDTYLSNIHTILKNEEKVVQDLSKIKEHISKLVSNDHLNIKVESNIIKSELTHQYNLKEMIAAEQNVKEKELERINKLKIIRSKIDSLTEYKTADINKEIQDLVNIRGATTERINTEFTLIAQEKEITLKTKDKLEEEILHLQDVCYTYNIVISDLLKKIEIFNRREAERVKSLSIEKKRRICLKI